MLNTWPGLSWSFITRTAWRRRNSAQGQAEGQPLAVQQRPGQQGSARNVTDIVFSLKQADALAAAFKDRNTAPVLHHSRQKKCRPTKDTVQEDALTYLTAAEHDAKNIGLYNLLQVVITAVGEGAVLVGVGARIVDPEGKGGSRGRVAVQASRGLKVAAAGKQGLCWKQATHSLTVSQSTQGTFSLSASTTPRAQAG